MLSYPSGMTVSNRALIMLADLLRQHRSQLRTRWRRLDAGRQALLVAAHLRKGETYADLACGFRIGTTTVYRYLCEAIELLAAMAPTLEQAIEIARGKAYVTLDTLDGKAPIGTHPRAGLRRRAPPRTRWTDQTQGTRGQPEYGSHRTP